LTACSGWGLEEATIMSKCSRWQSADYSTPLPHAAGAAGISRAARR
jgi:hypothetical protein